MTNSFLPSAYNPFIMALEDDQQQPGGSGVQNQLVNNNSHRCKLPDFWPNNPTLWFSRAEFNFEVTGIVDQRQKFMYIANALPYDSLTLVLDLVMSPPAVDPYASIKDRLLISHKMTSVQIAEKVLDMPSLGDRRPSQLLAAMLEFCPEGESDTSFFRASFFRRLPKEIRVLMADEVNGNLKEMAIRADELFQHHRSSVMATVSGGGGEEGDDGVNSAVAALNIKGKFQKKKTGL